MSTREPNFNVEIATEILEFRTLFLMTFVV